MSEKETFVEKLNALITTRTDAKDNAKFAELLSGARFFRTEFAEYLWTIKDTKKYYHSSEARGILTSKKITVQTPAKTFTKLANKMLFDIKNHNPGGGFEVKSQTEAGGKHRVLYMFTFTPSGSGSGFDAIMETLDKIEIDFGLMDLATSGFVLEDCTLTELLYLNARIAARKVTDLYMEDKVQFEPFDFDKRQAPDGWLFGLVQHIGDCCKLFMRNYTTEMTVDILGTLTEQQLIDMKFLLDVPFLTFEKAEHIVKVEHDKKIVRTLRPVKDKHEVFKLYLVLLGNAKHVAEQVHKRYDDPAHNRFGKTPVVKIPAIDIDRMARKIEEAKDDWNAVCKLLKPLICWLFDFVGHVCSQLRFYGYIKMGTRANNDARINYGLQAVSYKRVALNHSAVRAATDKFPGLPLKHSGESWFNLAMHGTNYVDTLQLELSEEQQEQPSKKQKLAASFFDRGIINFC